MKWIVYFTLMWEYEFSLARILPYKDKIYGSVLVRDNEGHWKLVFSHILRSDTRTKNYKSVSFSSNFKKQLNTKCITKPWNIKGTHSGLRQFLDTESPLKMMKNPFYFTLKKLFSFSKYLNFCLDFFCSCRKKAWLERWG